MADRRRHRGPHPADGDLFSSPQHRPLREAVSDLSWLFGRGYVLPSALKLVGDRYQLAERQRTAVMRAACSDEARQLRLDRRAELRELTGAAVAIDGFNLLTTIEAALSGGVLLSCRDGVIRDMASMHGTYRTVEETEPALILIGRLLTEYRVASAHWWLDRPVSNSGRLATLIRKVAADQQWNWTADLHLNPDRQLIDTQDAIIISADRVVMENSVRWWPLANAVVNTLQDVWLVNLGDAPHGAAASQ
ncbi:MAG: DUF434 domain-containing protein [Planctomycetaceae bacterium]|nr:DUF434 domain-containing protein [Planctomycetaceae bacterium]